jgi:hypothetical protein
VAALAAGCPKPTALTASGGVGQIILGWTAPTGPTPVYTYNIKRATVSGGPYTTVQTGVSGTNYNDSTVVVGTPYYYVVSAVAAGESGDSNQATATAPPVTALPNTGLQTSELPTTTGFDITFVAAAPSGGSTVTVISNDTSEGAVSTTYGSPTPIMSGTDVIGFSVVVPQATSPTIPVTVTGVGDNLIDGNIPYTISVTVTGFGGLTIPDVNVTNNDTNTPGITLSTSVGLVTTEAGGQAQLTVSLSTAPFGVITMSLTSSNTAEVTVSPSSITFTAANWNSAQPITLTGVDDALLDFNQPWTVVTGNLSATDPRDAIYNNMVVPDIFGVNVDDETIPPAPSAWGGGGGCGLLGLEILLPLLAFGAGRRRSNFRYRNSKK